MRLEFKKLQREFSATILYVSHDQLEAMTMGDRIIVINAGTIQQIGPPREIFESPANRFVAGFVGEPAMNFLPCNLEMSGGGRSAIVGNGFRIATEPALLERLGTLRRAPGGLEIGLRPQHLALAAPAESASDDVLAGTIYAIEALGSATIFDVSVGNRIVRVQAKQNSLIGRNFQIGEPVGVRVDRHLVYLFDEVTGKTVSQPGSSAGRPPEASKLAG
jgi:multiple sugar transport system ATP-binding protein